MFGDRAGLRRSVIAGACLMAAAAAGMAAAASGLTPLGVVSTVVLFLGFEFAFVANLTLVSGVGGQARGAFVGLHHTVSTGCRGLAAAVGTATYDRWSMRPVALATVALAVAAALATTIAARSAGGTA